MSDCQESEVTDDWSDGGRHALVGIPRDGDERAIKIHTETYDESIALEALEWLAEVKRFTEAPEGEKYVAFCNLYFHLFDMYFVNLYKW